MRTNKIVLISGGFDPIHIGHVRMIREAKSRGEVWVALNSDAWLVRKKGFRFQTWEERAAILSEMGCEVWPVNDDDGTVCEAIRILKPDYFANGGDRNLDNTPEIAVCNELGVGLLWNIGGEKANSSSLIANLDTVRRQWGCYRTLFENANFKVKLLTVMPGCATSMQRHRHRNEVWVRSSGVVNTLPKNMWHQLSNDTGKPMELVEVQTGDYFGEDDIERR